MSKKIILFCRNDKIMYYFSTFHDNLRQRKPGDAKNVVALCRIIAKNIAEKYCRKILPKNLIEKSCWKTLYNTIFLDIIWQISPKTSRRCEKCGRILAYNVENLCCFLAKKMLSHYNSTLFLCNIFRQILCRKMFLSNQVEKS